MEKRSYMMLCSYVLCLGTPVRRQHTIDHGVIKPIPEPRQYAARHPPQRIIFLLLGDPSAGILCPLVIEPNQYSPARPVPMPNAIWNSP